MIIGNGLIANSFRSSLDDDKNFIMFASGVSNSNETRVLEFKREKTLLIKTIQDNTDKIFIYISSCNLENTLIHVQYYQHKLNMEKIIKKLSKNYYIFRLPQVVGKTDNKNTLFGFLFDKINNNIEFDLWVNARRNLIDIDDVNLIINTILRKRIFKNSIINIASPSTYSILEIVIKIEMFLGKKVKYKELNKGDKNDIDISKICEVISMLNLKFDDTYLDNLIEKYAPFFLDINAKRDVK